MESIKTLLKGVHLFKELTDQELDSIVDISYRREFREKMMVFMQGDPLDRVFFIVTGTVKIYKTDLTGKEQIVSILQAGDMFPHTGFFRQGKYPAHAEIMEKSVLVVIPIAEFEHLLLRHPKICIKLFRVMSERIIDLQNRLEEQILHNTYEQIIMLLLRLCRAYGQPAEHGFTRLNMHFTNRELANMIGASRETMSRTLTQLKKKGWIDSDPDGYFLIHTDHLKDELFTM